MIDCRKALTESNGDFEAVKAIAGRIKNSVVCSLARAKAADIERAAEPRRRPERQERADPADFSKDHVGRHHDDRERDHHGRQADREHGALAGKFDAREAVRRDRAG